MLMKYTPHNVVYISQHCATYSHPMLIVWPGGLVVHGQVGSLSNRTQFTYPYVCCLYLKLTDTLNTLNGGAKAAGYRV